MSMLIRPLIALENAVNAYLSKPDWFVGITFAFGVIGVALATCLAFPPAGLN